MENNKVKKFRVTYKENTDAEINLFYGLDEIKRKRKNIEFQNWFNEEYENTTKMNIFLCMYEDLLALFKEEKINIKLKKQFKNDLAKFVYNSSSQ